MTSGLSDSLTLEIDDALALARGMRGYAAEVAYGTVAPSSFGSAANQVTSAFAGFRLGTVCATKAADTASANKALADTLEQIGDNTNAVTRFVLVSRTVVAGEPTGQGVLGIRLVLPTGLAAETVQDLATRVGEQLATDGEFRARVDGVSFILATG